MSINWKQRSSAKRILKLTTNLLRIPKFKSTTLKIYWRASGIVITAGHNMSQVDDNSSEGDSTSDRNPALTGRGCYRNYDHVASHRKSSHNVVSFLKVLAFLHIQSNLIA